MLRLESSMLSSLSHPNIVRYFGLHYSHQRREYNMILEYVDGGSLAEHVKSYPTGLPLVRCSHRIYRMPFVALWPNLELI